jgi:3-phytase
MNHALSILLLAVLAQLPTLAPARQTGQVPNDPDDPAIWVHPTDPSRSLIFGTDKMPGTGGLYAFGLDGTLKQTIAPLDRPNNVDVAHGFDLGGTRTDIVVVTERLKHRLRIFAISADGHVRDLAPNGAAVLAGQAGEAAEPMGVALYERARDGAIFAIVAPKTGGATNYLWQYRLEYRNSTVVATMVRRFGSFSRIGAEAGTIGEIEAVVVDDALGYVYYSDERFGIHKWHADPDHADAAKELAVIGRSGYQGDREGLAIYAEPDGGGFLVSSDQVPGATRLMIYPRSGPAGRLHDQPLLVAIPTKADSTDGLEVTSRTLPGLAGGMLVMMNSSSRNFLIYDWREVMKRIGPRSSTAARP